MAGSLAKSRTSSDKIDVISIDTPYDILTSINSYIHKIWQATYDGNTTGRFYHQIEPEITSKIKYVASPRHKEVMISRLRFGKCGLNKYLHDIRKHNDGFCDTCYTPETIEHLLLSCHYNGSPEKIRNRCTSLNINPTLTDILKIKLLADYCTYIPL